MLDFNLSALEIFLIKPLLFLFNSYAVNSNLIGSSFKDFTSVNLETFRFNPRIISDFKENLCPTNSKELKVEALELALKGSMRGMYEALTSNLESNKIYLSSSFKNSPLNTRILSLIVAVFSPLQQKKGFFSKYEFSEEAPKKKESGFLYTNLKKAWVSWEEFLESSLPKNPLYDLAVKIYQFTLKGDRLSLSSKPLKELDKKLKEKSKTKERNILELSADNIFLGPRFVEDLIEDGPDMFSYWFNQAILNFSKFLWLALKSLLWFSIFYQGFINFLGASFLNPVQFLKCFLYLCLAFNPITLTIGIFKILEFLISNFNLDSLNFLNMTFSKVLNYFLLILNPTSFFGFIKLLLGQYLKMFNVPFNLLIFPVCVSIFLALSFFNVTLKIILYFFNSPLSEGFNQLSNNQFFSGSFKTGPLEFLKEIFFIPLELIVIIYRISYLVTTWLYGLIIQPILSLFEGASKVQIVKETEINSDLELKQIKSLMQKFVINDTTYLKFKAVYQSAVKNLKINTFGEVSKNLDPAIQEYLVEKAYKGYEPFLKGEDFPEIEIDKLSELINFDSFKGFLLFDSGFKNKEIFKDFFKKSDGEFKVDLKLKEDSLKEGLKSKDTWLNWDLTEFLGSLVFVNLNLYLIVDQFLGPKSFFYNLALVALSFVVTISLVIFYSSRNYKEPNLELRAKKENIFRNLKSGMFNLAVLTGGYLAPVLFFGYFEIDINLILEDFNSSFSSFALNFQSLITGVVVIKFLLRFFTLEGSKSLNLKGGLSLNSFWYDIFSYYKGIFNSGIFKDSISKISLNKKHLLDYLVPLVPSNSELDHGSDLNSKEQGLAPFFRLFYQVLNVVLLGNVLSFYLKNLFYYNLFMIFSALLLLNSLSKIIFKILRSLGILTPDSLNFNLKPKDSPGVIPYYFLEKTLHNYKNIAPGDPLKNPLKAKNLESVLISGGVDIESPSNYQKILEKESLREIPEKFNFSRNYPLLNFLPTVILESFYKVSGYTRLTFWIFSLMIHLFHEVIFSSKSHFDALTTAYFSNLILILFLGGVILIVLEYSLLSFFYNTSYKRRYLLQETDGLLKLEKENFQPKNYKFEGVKNQRETNWPYFLGAQGLEKFKEILLKEYPKTYNMIFEESQDFYLPEDRFKQRIDFLKNLFYLANPIEELIDSPQKVNLLKDEKLKSKNRFLGRDTFMIVLLEKMLGKPEEFLTERTSKFDKKIVQSFYNQTLRKSLQNGFNSQIHYGIILEFFRTLLIYNILVGIRSNWALVSNYVITSLLSLSLPLFSNLVSLIPIFSMVFFINIPDIKDNFYNLLFLVKGQVKSGGSIDSFREGVFKNLLGIALVCFLAVLGLNSDFRFKMDLFFNWWLGVPLLIFMILMAFYLEDLCDKTITQSTTQVFYLNLILISILKWISDLQPIPLILVYDLLKVFFWSFFLFFLVYYSFNLFKSFYSWKGYGAEKGLTLMESLSFYSEIMFNGLRGIKYYNPTLSAKLKRSLTLSL